MEPATLQLGQFIDKRLGKLQTLETSGRTDEKNDTKKEMPQKAAMFCSIASNQFKE